MKNSSITKVKFKLQLLLLLVSSLLNSFLSLNKRNKNALIWLSNVLGIIFWEDLNNNLNLKSQVLHKVCKMFTPWRNKCKTNIMMTCLILKEDSSLGSTSEKTMKEITKISEKILQPALKNFKWLNNHNDITPSPYFLFYL